MSACLAHTRAGLRALLAGRTRVLVAVSGGPDSQALLDCCAHWAQELDLTLWAAGIDHGLRPAAAAELDCARALAERHGIPFVARRLEALAPGNRLAAARRGRLGALRAIAREVGAQAIALGHHAGDQAETLLMHLVRGCGPRGLAGMPARRGALVRPLLSATRADILAHLAARDIAFVTDPSNSVAERTRTQLRTVVLPALERINPAAIPHLARACASQRPLVRDMARRVQRLVRSEGEGPENRSRLALAPLRRARASLRIAALAEWLVRNGLVASHARLDDLCRLVLSPTPLPPVCVRGGHVVREGAYLICRPGRPMLSTDPVAWAGVELPLARIGRRPTLYELGGHAVALWQGARCENKRARAPSRDAVAFAVRALHCGVSLRPWQPGDKLRLRPEGGHALVADLFGAARVPRALRASWPVLVMAGEVLWVPSIRRASAAFAADEDAAQLWLEHRTCPAIIPSTLGEKVV